VKEGKLTIRQHRHLIFTSWLLALTIALTVFDAPRISFPAMSQAPALARLPSFQMERTAQKAPYDLTFWRVFDNLRKERGLAAEDALLPLDLPRSLMVFADAHEFSPGQNNAFESPRAPPRAEANHSTVA
jgi:hypothetical protein